MITEKTDGKVTVRKAGRDIPCLKLVAFQTNDIGEKECFTPYMYLKVHDDVLRGEADLTPVERVGGFAEITDISEDKAAVHGGYIHVYATAGDGDGIPGAYLYLLGQSALFEKSVAAYLCVIPEGTEYIEGSCTEGSKTHKCYCAKAVRFKEKLLDVSKDTSWTELYSMQSKFKKTGTV